MVNMVNQGGAIRMYSSILAGRLRSMLKHIRREKRAWEWYWKTYQEYVRLQAKKEGNVPEYKYYPCLYDNTAKTDIEPIYFYQDWWAMRNIAKSGVTSHVDVGSHHKYISLLAATLDVTFVDLRPLSKSVPGMKEVNADVLRLPFRDASVHSLSSLCVLEHIGLGRYGDALKPEGSEDAIREIIRVCAVGGVIYVSVPLADVNTVYFNAHRAFSIKWISDMFLSCDLEDSCFIVKGQCVHEYCGGEAVGCFMYRRKR